MLNDISKVPFGLLSLDENAIKSVIEDKYSEELKSSNLINAQALIALGLLAKKKERK